jgi:hypothetical protein
LAVNSHSIDVLVLVVKPIFISTPNKLLFSILTIILLVAAGYLWLSLTRLQNEFQPYQVTALKKVEQQLEFLLSVLLIFYTVSVLTCFIIKLFTSRLIRLSQAFPKLAKRELYQFREFDISKKSMFIDELDSLAKASNTLSLDLEQLNLDVEQKTKELENITMYDLLTGLPNRNMPSLVYTLPSDDKLHQKFSKEVLRIFLYQLDKIWIKLTYSGLGKAPVIGAIEQLKLAVSITPCSIGYVDNVIQGENVYVLKI